MHYAVLDFITECVQYVDPSEHRVFLEIGSRDVNGGIRHLFPWADSYTGLDITPGKDVDIVADASMWTPDREYDVIISTEVLEHSPVWMGIVTTGINALRPGGVMILTCATYGRSPHNAHGAPTIDTDKEYYENVPVASFTSVVEPFFSEFEVRRTCGADLQFRGVRNGWTDRRHPCDDSLALRWPPRVS